MSFFSRKKPTTPSTQLPPNVTVAQRPSEALAQLSTKDTGGGGSSDGYVAHLSSHFLKHTCNTSANLPVEAVLQVWASLHHKRPNHDPLRTEISVQALPRVLPVPLPQNLINHLINPHLHPVSKDRLIHGQLGDSFYHLLAFSLNPA
jgi:hypothetical protein